MIQPRPLSDLLALAAPLIVWAAHFSTLYGSESFLCGLGPTLPAAATIVAALALASLVVFFHNRSSNPFQRAVGLTLCIIATLAVTWTMIPLFLMYPCQA